MLGAQVFIIRNLWAPCYFSQTTALTVVLKAMLFTYECFTDQYTTDSL